MIATNTLCMLTSLKFKQKNSSTNAKGSASLGRLTSSIELEPIAQNLTTPTP